MGMIFAKNLKKLRTEKGLSQRELAERLYVSRTSVNRWECGNRLPDAAPPVFNLVRYIQKENESIEILLPWNASNHGSSNAAYSTE